MAPSGGTFFWSWEDFDIQKYPRPSIEDIELGVRLGAAGHRILVNKDIQVKHLKRWTLLNLLKTDIFDRGIPWTLLILQQRSLPNDLNLNRSQRWSTMLLVILLVYLGIGAIFFHPLVILPLLAGLYIAVISSWQVFGSSLLMRMSIKAEVFTYLLLVAVSGLAIIFGFPELLLSSGVLLALMLIGRALPVHGDTLRSFLFDLIVISFIATLVLLLFNYPLWTVLPLILVVTLILWLNRNYYLFLARIRGSIFALAVLPFQLFYYLYSIIAFGAGYGTQVAAEWQKPKTKPEKQV